MRHGKPDGFVLRAQQNSKLSSGTLTQKLIAVTRSKHVSCSFRRPLVRWNPDEGPP